MAQRHRGAVAQRHNGKFVSDKYSSIVNQINK
jgi:hypothetical protein